VALTGTPFQVAAIDGYEIPGAAMLTATRLTIPGGGRYDLLFQQPTVGTPWLQVLNGAGTAALAVGNTAGHAPAPGRLADFDLTRYGTHSRAAGLTPETRYTRDYTIDLDAAFGWYNGHFGLHYTMNGKLFPDGPMLHVREGDTVKVTFVNRTSADHPMHLHGHHFTVLEKDGKPLTGAPMELDTLNVEPHETWTIAFRADNPGLWMFHCHNLTHASQGMDMMVMYEGVTSPYTIGDRSANHPE
jgi:FtsP/CotA-like multicopper oxidase with cupredoxin domain